MPTTTRGADTVFASADWDTPWHFRVERIYGREILRPDTQVEKDAGQDVCELFHAGSIAAPHASALVNPGARFQTPDNAPNR